MIYFFPNLFNVFLIDNYCGGIVNQNDHIVNLIFFGDSLSLF